MQSEMKKIEMKIYYVYRNELYPEKDMVDEERRVEVVKVEDAIRAIRSLLEYIKSITQKGIILYNAMYVLKLRPGPNKFKGKIVITDLALNKYDPIDIEVEIDVKASNEIYVPVYQLFEWR